MPNRLLQLLGSYDLFGKSVPGALLIFGFWMLLPEGTLELSSQNETSLVNIAALLIILLLLGLMIGQGLHTLADNVEKVFRWLLVRIVDLQGLVLLKYGIEVNFDQLRVNEDGTEESDTSAVQKFLNERWNDTITWIERRFWGTWDSFASHRFLFSKWFEWNYDKSTMNSFSNRWEKDAMSPLMDPFADRFDEIYPGGFEDGKSIRQARPENIEKIYPLVTSRLAAEGIQSHRQFHAIYSFCRSMWVVSLTLAIIYAVVIYRPLGITGVLSENPRLLSMPELLLMGFPLLLLLSTIVFMDASGTYKRHYIEYTIAAFANGDCRKYEQDNQSRLDRF